MVALFALYLGFQSVSLLKCSDSMTEISSDHRYRSSVQRVLIYQTILKDHIKINNYLKQSILEHRRKYPKSITSNVKAWHSDWQTHLKDSNFKPFSNLVTDACEYISTYDWNQNFWEFEVIDMWAMVYKESNYESEEIQLITKDILNYFQC